MTKKSAESCQTHGRPVTQFCLADECKSSFMVCDHCIDQGAHKHSQVDLMEVGALRDKLISACEPKDSPMDGICKKIGGFYANLRREVDKLLDEDQQAVERCLQKVKYHHLPIGVNSQVYIDLLELDFSRLDRNSLMRLVNEVENGEPNKNLEKQKEVINFVEAEMSRSSDKLLTIKYILLAKKLEAELLIPAFPEPSKVCSDEQLSKIYGLFSSRKLPIRSAKLIYRASENEFSAKAFWTRCCGSNDCLAIFKAQNGQVVGGYSPSPLSHHDPDSLPEEGHYEPDRTMRSFIFSVTNLRSFSLKDPSKAILYKKGVEGPQFGIDLAMGKSCTSSMGHSYEAKDGLSVDSLESKVYLLQGDKVQLQEL